MNHGPAVPPTQRQTFDGNALGRLTHEIAVAGEWWHSERTPSEQLPSALSADLSRPIAGNVSPHPPRVIVAVEGLGVVEQETPERPKSRLYVYTVFIGKETEHVFKLTGREYKRKVKAVEKLRQACPGVEIKTRVVLE